MKTKIIKLVVFIASIAVMLANIAPIFANTLEIEILGGGYKLRGPEEILFGNVTAQISDFDSELNFRDIEIETVDTLIEDGALTIIDENGGSEFSVTVSATHLKRDLGGGSTANCTTDPEDCILRSNFFIKNQDDSGTTEDLTTVYGDAGDFSLDASTDSYADLTGTNTLGNGTGVAPGMWKIYPSLRITVPAGQKPGSYLSTLSFTIA